MKILVADDHALVREGMRHVLTQLADDVTVVEAEDYAEVLQAIDSATSFSLAILDLHMPGHCGFGALDTLSQRHAALPVVVLSGSEDRSHMRRPDGTWRSPPPAGPVIGVGSNLMRFVDMSTEFEGELLDRAELLARFGRSD